MAIGLDFLGRGKGWRAIRLRVAHVVGAMMGGAAVGSLLGWLGVVLSLTPWRPEIIAVTVVFALWQSVTGHPAHLGLRRQVPRRWPYALPLPLCYFLWGVLLGCGIATLIPYSSLVVVLGLQLTSGVALGCASGALFGATRETMALLALLPRRDAEANPKEVMCLLPTLQATVRHLNLLWVIGGGLLLMFVARSP